MMPMRNSSPSGRLLPFSGKRCRRRITLAPLSRSQQGAHPGSLAAASNHLQLLRAWSFFLVPVAVQSMPLHQCRWQRHRGLRSTPGVLAGYGPADIYPDLTITPGVAASDVTQDNIQTTICVSGFTAPPRRPPSSYTDKLKVKGFDEYGLSDRNKGDYEEDHLISLEIGGDPKDPNNLWPEPYQASIPDGGARFKDKVETYLKGQICQGKMTLADAQKAIVTDWYQVYQAMPKK
jgi:hypothetical protein